MQAITRIFAAAAVGGLVAGSSAVLAIGTPAPDLGWLGALAQAPEHPVMVESKPELLPAKVFDIPIGGVTTFSQATAKLGAAAVRHIGSDESGPRYICYRSTRGRPAVIAVFTSQSTVREDLIDGFAFGLQSGVPDAVKVCRQVPWLKADDLKFDKVAVEMPKDKLPAPLRNASTENADDRIALLWPGATAGSAPPALGGIFAAINGGKLVFFYANSAGGAR